MAASAEPIRDPFAAVAEDRRLHYFRRRIKDFKKDISTKAELFAQFREWLDQLTDEVILRSHQQHYNPTYLNLLSVFGEELTNEEVHSLAIKCIKAKLLSECEYYFHLSQLFELIKSGPRKPQPAADQSAAAQELGPGADSLTVKPRQRVDNLQFPLWRHSLRPDRLSVAGISHLPDH